MSNRDPTKYLAKVDDHRLVPRWKAIIDKVYKELLGLNEDRQIMAAALAVFNANPRLIAHPVRAYFLDSVRRWYGLAMAIAVRRQLDTDPRSASLRVLIQELEVRHMAYRTQNLKQLSPRAAPNAFASLGLAMKDANGNLDVAKIRDDLNTLTELDRQVGDYVDRHIAHTNLDPARSVEGPLYSDIEESFDRLERVAGRYMGLFYSGSYTLRVGMSHGWIDGFEFPWRIRPSPVALETKAYLVRLDALVSKADAEAFWEDALDSEAMVRRRGEFIQRMIETAAALEPEQTASEVFAPDDVTIERVQ